MNKDIVIRKADKSNCYVILDYEDYKEKLSDITSDGTKFKPIGRDAKKYIKNIKRRLNGHITAINAVKNEYGFKILEGEYTPGYLYGNPKTHKGLENPPLLPIISQLPPTK